MILHRLLGSLALLFVSSTVFAQDRLVEWAELRIAVRPILHTLASDIADLDPGSALSEADFVKKIYARQRERGHAWTMTEWDLLIRALDANRWSREPESVALVEADPRLRLAVGAIFRQAWRPDAFPLRGPAPWARKVLLRDKSAELLPRAAALLRSLDPTRAHSELEYAAQVDARLAGLAVRGRPEDASLLYEAIAAGIPETLVALDADPMLELALGAVMRAKGLVGAPIYEGAAPWSALTDADLTDGCMGDDAEALADLEDVVDAVTARVSDPGDVSEQLRLLAPKLTQPGDRALNDDDISRLVGAAQRRGLSDLELRAVVEMWNLAARHNNPKSREESFAVIENIVRGPIVAGNPLATVYRGERVTLSAASADATRRRDVAILRSNGPGVEPSVTSMRDEIVRAGNGVYFYESLLARPDLRARDRTSYYAALREAQAHLARLRAEFRAAGGR